MILSKVVFPRTLHSKSSAYSFTSKSLKDKDKVKKSKLIQKFQDGKKVFEKQGLLNNEGSLTGHQMNDKHNFRELSENEIEHFLGIKPNLKMIKSESSNDNSNKTPEIKEKKSSKKSSKIESESSNDKSHKTPKITQKKSSKKSSKKKVKSKKPSVTKSKKTKKK